MTSTQRRKLLAAGGLTALGLWALKPAAKGAPHSPYFVELARAIKLAGIATPTLVIDRQQLRNNASKVMAHIAQRMDFRLVVKSLPSQALIEDITSITKSRRMMLFSLPQLDLMAKGDADILLGKPMPVAAAAKFYQSAGGAQQDSQQNFKPEQQLQWLIDSPERLLQYRELARQRALTMRLNFELDVGLHRGGISSSKMLHEMLEILQSEPRLQFSGMMGYDAHVAKIPDLPGLREQAHLHAHELYTRLANQALASVATFKGGATPSEKQKLVFNAAGSPTYRLYDGSGIQNELSLGSAMLKPSDFDLPGLADLSPAVFIATPVLKVQEKFMMPYGVEAIGNLARSLDVNQQNAAFIYGGNWLADPVSPPGLSASALYGNSSNQQVLVGSGNQQLKVDDIVFFRPRQSEAVLQQFGDIAVYENGKIVDMWEVFPATA
jgi:D-serine deaminase-like pyridoxal phosphate-dependent protein